MPGIIVSDTSCLILFEKIEKLDLLRKLFGKVHITDTVLRELNRPVPDWIEVAELKTDLRNELKVYLDEGEASIIALAFENKKSLLIIDEIKGRKVAKEKGIRVTGSLGVLITAKEKGYLKAVKPVINKIQTTNFRISEDLIDKVLAKAGES